MGMITKSLLVACALFVLCGPAHAQRRLTTHPTGNESGTVTRPIQRPATVDAENAEISADTTSQAAATNLRLQGWTIRESAGTPAVATVVLRHDADGACDGTGVFAYIELAANGSDQQSYGDKGLAAASGVCADVLAGTVDVNIFTTTE